MSDAPPDDPYLGRVVAEKFHIDAQLGVGSFGTVYRATHTKLGRPVALKVLRASLAADPTNVERFTREARLASQLEHPNVVRVYDYGTDPDGLTYLAMEYLDGSDLSVMIARESPLDPARVVRLVAQVLGAVAAAQPLGIVHRDLKPDNILVVTRPGDDGKLTEIAKVADFGIARTYGEAASGMDAITRFGTVNGTPEYMSPEQALAEELDVRSDLYACGVILFEMFTGRLPFTGETALEVLEQHLRSEPPLPSKFRPGLDPGLEAVVMRALKKKRDERFADATEMRAALLAAMEKAALAPPANAAGSVLVEISAPDEPQAPRAGTGSWSMGEESGGGSSSVMVELGDEPSAAENPRENSGETAPSVLVESGPSVMVEPEKVRPSAPVERTTTERVAPVRKGGAARAVLGALAFAAACGAGYWAYRTQPWRNSGGGRVEPAPAIEPNGAVDDAGAGSTADAGGVRRRPRPVVPRGRGAVTAPAH